MCDRCNALQAQVDLLTAMLAMKTRADLTGRLRTALGVTPHQAKFLLMLYRTPGRVVDHVTLRGGLDRRYTKGPEPSEHYLRVTVYQMRKLIGEAAVRTIIGRGYMLSEEGLDLVRDAIAGKLYPNYGAAA